MTELDVGSQIPDISLVGENGPVALRSLVGKRALVLYFYPKDNTPGCTVEACSFRDAYEDFTDAGADVVGVSRDSVEKHTGFRAKQKLPFTLLSDLDGKAIEAFGVKKTFGLMPGRVTFVIDREGIIRHRFSSQLGFSKHAGEALAVVKRLQTAS